MSKADGAKLPKSIGGLKVPKGLRRAGFLDDILASQAGRELLAEAMIKGAEAAAAVLLRHEPQPTDEPAPTPEPDAAAPEPDMEAPSAEPPVARRGRGRPRSAPRGGTAESQPEPTPPMGN